MWTKVLISIFAFIFVMVTEQPAHAESSLEGNYIYPSNKEKVFSETIDQFYEALRKRSYPVHQEFYRKHYEFYQNIKIN